MFSTTSSILLHVRKPLLLYNVCGRHQLRGHQDTFHAFLLAKLWIKEKEKHDLIKQEANNFHNYLEENCDYPKEGDDRLNKNECLMLGEDQLIQTISLIHNYMLSSDTWEETTNHSSGTESNKVVPQMLEDRPLCLDKVTCDILYMTLGKHIDEIKDNIF